MGGARERKAASAHFRSLWLAAAGPGLVPWRLLSFAVRDTGPETERGRGGRVAGAVGAGWRSPAPRPAHLRVSAPCPGGVSECPGDAEETSTVPAFQRKGQLFPYRRDFADAAI